MGMSREQGIKTVYDGPSHVVILGAGASISSNIHNPEPSGRQLPSMANFLDIVDLTDIVENIDANGDIKNFETIYSVLYSQDPGSPVLIEIEERVRDYFQSLALPPTPTIYDYLVLSLRSKDIIATFNWDPFLYKAFCRNHHVGDLPRITFLHGSVSVGYSVQEQKAGPAGWFSKTTGDEYVPTKLLYPVTQKNYNDDEFIRREWDRLKRGLETAKRMTIFGYSAPDSDVEAAGLMRGAWGDPNQRNLEQIEFIDILPEEVMMERWDSFVYPGHHEYKTDYFDSVLAYFPRRTGESFMHQFLPSTEDEALQEPNIVPRSFGTLEEMWEWYRPLVEAENQQLSNR